MPWSWECRAKLIKQVPAKPTQRRRGEISNTGLPGPQQYDVPAVFCGKGFSKIKRAPAYSFGHRTPVSFSKPATTTCAPMINVQGLGRKGIQKIPQGVISPQIDAPGDKTKAPGPTAYAPAHKLRYKRPPAYTMRLAAKPPYQPWDQWTPPPNMYWPPIFDKKAPAFTLGSKVKSIKDQKLPGPGEHDPRFDYVKKAKPAFSFGVGFPPVKPNSTPAPNTYCEKKVQVLPTGLLILAGYFSYEQRKRKLKLAKNNTYHERTKHIDIRHHFTRDSLLKK